MTKNGNGVLQLSGDNTFSGGVNVTAGTLLVANATGSSTGTGAVSVTGATTVLGGAGSVSGLVTVGSGSTLSPGGAATAGTITLGGLTLAAGSKLTFQLGANTAASDQVVVTSSGGFAAAGGALTLDTTTLTGFGNGTYSLITYAGTLGGSFANLTLASPNLTNAAGAKFFGYLVNNVGSVDLQTTNSLTWNGDVSGTKWVNSTTADANFKVGSVTGVNFQDSMAVVFDDTAASYLVNLPGTVTPSSVSFNAANDYVLQGAGKVTGLATLAKSGSGRLTIDSPNDFSGAISLNAGSLEMKDPAALGSGTISITAGASLRLNDDGSGPIALASRITSYSGAGAIVNVAGQNSATLSTPSAATSFVSEAGKLTLAVGTLTVGTDRHLTLLGNGGDFEVTGTSISSGNFNFTVTMNGGTAVIAPSITVGADRAVTVNGTGSTTFASNLTSSSTTTGLSVSNTGTNLFNGAVVVNGGGGGITLAGGTNTFTQNVTINGSGTLTVSGGTTVFGAGRTVTTNGGAVSLSGSADTTFDANVTSGGGAWTVSSSDNTTLNGTLTGSGGLTKSGAGTLTFNATSGSYSGAVGLQPTSGQDRGIIVANANNALGTGAVTAVFNTGAIRAQIQLTGGRTLANNFTTSGAGTNGTLNGIIRAVSGANTLTGNVTLTGGGGNSTYRADTGASLAFNGNIGANNQTLRYIVLVGGGDFSFGSAGSIAQTLTADGSTGLWSINTGTTRINSTANTYALVTAVGGGSTLVVANLSNGGVAGSLGAATTASGNLLLDGGTLRYAGSGAQSTDRLFSVGSALNGGGGATLDASGATSADTMSFTGAGPIGFTGMTGVATSGAEAGPRTLTLTGTNTGANTLTSIIGDQAAGTGITSVTKSGVGKWMLDGANTYTGLTSVSNGVLNVQNALALGSTTGGTSVASGATLQIQVDGIGAEGVTISGSGAAGQSGALVNVSGDNNYGGLLTLAASASVASDAGMFTLSNVGTITGSGFNLTLAGAGDGVVESIISTGNGSVIKQGPGAWTLSGANTYAGQTSINGGVLNVGSSSHLGNASATNTISLSSGGILRATASFNAGLNRALSVGTGGGGVAVGGGVTLALPGLVSGAGLLEKSGDGTLILSAANETFDGEITVSGGLLLVSNDAGLGTTTGATSVTSGGSLGFQGGVTIAAEDLLLNGAGFANSGALRNVAGSNTVNSQVTLQSDASIRSADGTLVFGPASTIQVGSRTLTFGGAADIDVKGTIVGNGIGSVVKEGAGTLAITGVLNLGAAEVTVAEGVLNKVFTVADTVGAVNVLSGAKLSLNNSGFDSSAGVFKLSGGSVLDLEIGSAGSNDFISLTSGSTVSGSITIDLSAFGVLSAGTYTLLTSSVGTDLSSASWLLGLAPSGWSYQLDASSNSLILTTSGQSFKYFTGASGLSWNAAGNWSDDQAGSIVSATTPSASDSLVFSASNFAPSGASYATTLDASFDVDGLVFNAAPGAIASIVIAPGSGGALTLSPGSIGNGINVKESAGAIDISAPIVVGTSQTWTVEGGAGASSLTLSGGVSFNAKAIKAGAGVLTLSGMGDGSGGFVLNAGRVDIGHATAFGDGIVAFAAGVSFDNSSGAALVNSGGNDFELNGNLNFLGSNSYAFGTGAVSLKADVSLDVAGGTLTIGGSIDDGADSFTLTKLGAGVLVLDGANTFGGIGKAVTIQAGRLTIGGDSALGVAANSLTIISSGATSATGLGVTGTFVSGRTFNLNAALNSIDILGGQILTLTSPVLVGSASNSLVKNGSGRLDLSANSGAWTGAITLNSGQLSLGADEAVGSGAISIAPTLAVVGNALELRGGVTVGNTLTLQGTNNVFFGGVDFGGQLASVSGVNSYAGTINMAYDAAIGAAQASTLRLTGDRIVASATRQLSFNAVGEIDLQAFLVAPTNGFYAINKYGAGTLTITTPQSPRIAFDLNSRKAFNIREGSVVLSVRYRRIIADCDHWHDDRDAEWN